MPGSARRGRVLIADDDQLVRELHMEALGAAGFDIVGAEHGQAALRRLKRDRFEVLVTDLVMPGMDGLTLLDEAKRSQPGLEVIVLTSVDSVDTAVRAMRAGAWHYLLKPVSLEALVMDVTRCLDRQRLVRDHEELKRYAALFTVSMQLTTCLDADRLYPLSLETLRNAVGAQAAAFYLERGGELVAVAQRGIDRGKAEWLVEALQAARGPEFCEAASPVPLEGVGRLITARDPRLRRIEHALAVPLDLDGERLGTVFLFREEREGAFRPQECGDVGFIARCVTIALNNATRYDSARASARLDAMTGLRNASGMHSLLEQEMKRRESTLRPVTVLLIGLDGCGALNDSWGYQVGNEVIADLARLLQRQARDGDLAFREQGDIFALVLVDTPTREALMIAERIRRAAEVRRFLSREGIGARITVSIGVATWPDHAQSRTELLGAARRALDHAKSVGRNVVYAYNELPGLSDTRR